LVVDTKKQQLEMTLQRLRPLRARSPELEQYATPADIAADVLWEAFAAGHIEGRSVADLGCGNGIFAIGAKLMGAARVLGVDVDCAAVEVASENAKALSLPIDLHSGDVGALKGKFDTVVQNPPFGAQTRHADRKFVEKALELAPVAYSLHNDGTQEFVGKLVQTLGGRSETLKKYKFEIPYAFEFHRKATETVSVVLLRFER
jgi:putative methylase